MKTNQKIAKKSRKAIRRFLERHPDVKQSEIAELFQCSNSRIHEIVHKTDCWRS